MAHNITQSIDDTLGAWIHAHLHRIEGNIINANYWYRVARRKLPQESVKDEADTIIRFVTSM